MTKAQKENQARFKKVQAEAKKLKAKNPRLAHTAAVKQAWAIILGGKKVVAVKKKPAAKKPATRKASAKKQTGKTNIAIDKKIQAKAPGKRVSKSGNVYYEARANRSDKGRLLGVKKLSAKKPTVSKHKDTQSHNVNIRVMSGVGKIKIGAIPAYQDKDAAREIQLFADNDYQLYESQRLPILKNLAKKYQKGTFNIDRAADLWKYYVDNALKKYHKLYGSPRGNWYDLLSMQDRKRLAYDYAAETLLEFNSGNFEF